MEVITKELPPELAKFIKAKADVLRETIIVDGQEMTVAKLASEYRNQKTRSWIFASLALVAAVMLAGTTWWHIAHPEIRVVAVVPANK